MRILLHILWSFLVASRKYFSTQSSGKPEDTNTLLFAQDAAIVQVLLESCLATNLASNDPQKGNIEEIRTIVCNFLHQMFIENTLLIKLVHFQGYPAELIPVTVEGIPSMHICFEFLLELLNHQQVEKQIFAIKLTSYLAQKYPIPKSLSIARAIVQRLSVNAKTNPLEISLNQVITPRDDVNFYIETLPSLVLICSAFPMLTEEVVELLLSIKPIGVASVKNSSKKIVSLKFVWNKHFTSLYKK